MSEDFDDWNPMSDDFQSIAFNSYSSGQTAAHMPHNLVPVFGSEYIENRRQKYNLYVDGFPSDLTASGLKNFLRRIGCKFSTLKIVNSRKSESIGRRFSFVEFETAKEAQKAIELIGSQNLYKLSVRFASSQTDRQKREEVIERENQSFQRLVSKQFEMKPKIDIGNHSSINGNNSSLSPIQSESGSADSAHLDLLSPLAKSDKLVKVLERPEDNCSFCSQSQPIGHLHFILSQQQVIDPTYLPDLIDVTNTCHSCGRKGVDMKLCSQCKSAIYCDPKCQLNHWPRHRIDCRSETSSLLTFNSTLDSSKLLNGTDEQSFKSASKATERSSSERVVTKSSSEKITKTTPQIRVTPKESTPIVAPIESRGGGDRAEVKTAPKAPEVVKPKETVIPQEVLKTAPKQPEVVKPKETVKPQEVVKTDETKETTEKPVQETNKVKIIPIKLTVDTEVLTDGEEGVILCFGRNPFDFYLQKSSAEENMSVFADEIYKKMNDFPVLSNEELKKGALCGGIYAMDGNCYRARIVDKVNDNTFALYFIDYGNTEPVERKDIKRLPQIFFSCRAQAIPCSLEGIIPKNSVWSKDAIALFGEIGESNEFSKLKIFNKSSEGIYKIDLFNQKGDSIRKVFVEKGFATDGTELSEDSNAFKSPVSPPKKVNAVPPPPPRTPVNTESPILVQGSPKVIFNKSSINDLAVNYKSTAVPEPVLDFNDKTDLPSVPFQSFIEKKAPNSMIALMITNTFNAEAFQYFATIFDLEVQELIEGLANEYPANKPSVIPKVGDYVVVQGSDDECYRSYVLEMELKTAKVFMFDSGFIECVPKDKVFKLDEKYEKFPVYGVMLKPKTKFGARLIEMSQTNESPIEGTLLKREGQILLQKGDLFIELLDLKSMIKFVKENEPLFATEDEGGDPYEKLPLRQLPLNKSMEGFALFQDPIKFKVFYVAGDADDCSNLMGLCAKYSSKFDNNIRVNPFVGQCYLVRSPGDQEWYRAVVYSVDGDKARVKYIDFGNEEEIEIDYIMELSGELKISAIKPLAIKCRVESTKLTDDELKTKIQNATEGAYLLKMEVLRVEDGFHLVKVK